MEVEYNGIEVITFTSSAINALIYWNSEFRRAFPCTFPWLPCPHRSKQNAPDFSGQPEWNQIERNVGRCNLATKETKLWGQLKRKSTPALLVWRPPQTVYFKRKP